MLGSFLLTLLLLRSAFYDFGEISKGVYIEAWGTVFDLLLVGILLACSAIVYDRRNQITRHLEEIDDFKKWGSEEAWLRIAGSIRRLAKLGKTDIDLSGIVLRNVSFHEHDIESLKGSIFSLGIRFPISKNNTLLDNVDFSHVDCRDTVFSKYSGFEAVPALVGLAAQDLSFIDAKLNNARFDGAQLKWTDYKANSQDWYVDHGYDECGHHLIQQVYYPPFSGADLKGCSFQCTTFDHADFRQAENILAADFRGAKGLETCFFDEDVRDRVLAAAAVKPDVGD
jgi:uncharacterized protein YjbI with pentapeptide repeats